MINNNANITKETKRAFGLNELTGYPRKVAEAIIPVVEVNNLKNTIAYYATGVVDGDVTIHTTLPNKDFYITALQISMQKNAAQNAVIGEQAWISAIINGLRVHLIGLTGLTGTAQENIISISLNYPLKIDRETTILLSNTTYAAGLMSKTAYIHGFYVDNTGD